MVQQNQLVVADPRDGANFFSYSSSFPVELGFSRLVFNSAATDGLLLRSDSGGSTDDVYTFRLAAVPEPGVAALSVVGSSLLLQRRRNNKANKTVVARVGHVSLSLRSVRPISAVPDL